MRSKTVVGRVLAGASALLVSAAVMGCTEEAPPYEELPLRDALSAAPEVLASLPDEARRDIARRLDEAQAVEGEETIIHDAELRTPAALVLRADARREEEGKDANV